MDWLKDLMGKEARLRSLLTEFEAAAPERDFEQHIRPAIEEIQNALDDYLCGRDAEERAWMSYEVRLNLPVFSHLRSLYCLVSAAES